MSTVSGLTPATEEFKGAGKEPGLTIWRIEKLNPVLIPKEKYGQFFNGDSYIVLQAKLTRNQRLAYDIFFWIGSESSQDEVGAVAYRTCELGNALGGFAPHHRELEGNESPAFLSLFKDGFRVVAGGIESAFRTVNKDSFETQLLHLKGARNVRVSRVELAASSLNHGDVFILDYGNKLFIWNGKESSKAEKAKGVDVCQKLRTNEKKGNADMIILQDGEENEDSAEFFKVLNGSPADVKDAASAGEDAEHEKKQAEETVLYEMDADGKVKEIAKAKLRRDMLDSTKMYLVTSPECVYVWVGTKVDSKVKMGAFALAMGALPSINKPLNVQMERVVENAESTLFRDLFSVWKFASAIDPTKEGYSVSKVAGKLVQGKVELSTTRSAKPRTTFVPDEGTVELKVYRMADHKENEVPADRHAVFYSGDSYVITLSCKVKGNRRDFIFMWQGRNSPIDERGTSAFITKNLSNKMRLPTQIRIVQGHETPDFLQLFKGSFVVRNGETPADWESAAAIGSLVQTKAQAEEVALFQVKGYSPEDTRTYQVTTACASLNSGDTFVLLTADKAYVWMGKLSNEDERKAGKAVATLLKANRELVEVEEGSEPADFFTALGGKTDYVTYADSDEELPEPRLFHCSNAIGIFRTEEIANFSQDDLNVDDVMILDAYDYLYIWEGKGANETEKEMSLQIAKDYLAKKPDGRESTPIITLTQGNETPEFTQHFPGWVAKKEDEFVDPYQLRLMRLQEQSQATSTGGGVIRGMPKLRSTRSSAPAPKEQPTSSGMIQGMPKLRSVH